MATSYKCICVQRKLRQEGRTSGVLLQEEKKQTVLCLPRAVTGKLGVQTAASES